MEGIKPFNFLLTYQAKRSKDALISLDINPQEKSNIKLRLLPRAVAPYDSDKAMAVQHCFDRDTGSPVDITHLKTYRQALAQYHLHPEAKFLNGDCTDRGFTQRRHIVVSSIEYIGKEAHRWEEQLYLGLNPEAQLNYGAEPQMRKELLAKIRKAAKIHGQRCLARTAGVSRMHLLAILGKTTKPSDAILCKLSKAIYDLECVLS